MNEDRDDKDYQIMGLKQRVSYYEPYKQKYEDLKEDWKYVKSLLDKEFNERTRLKKENEQLRNELDKYKIVILQFVGLLVENGIIDSSVKEEVDELLEELSGDGV